MTRIFSFILRGGTLGSKLLLVLFLAKFFTTEDFAVFGLLSVSVAYAIYFSGFDFYTFSSRQFVQMDAAIVGRHLKTQFALFSLLFLGAALPFVFALTAGGVTPSVVILSLLILGFDLANQELERFLDSRSDHLVAGLVLFLRSGSWCIAFVCISLAFPGLRTLPVLLSSWLFGSVCGFFVAVMRTKGLGFGGWKAQIAWQWLWTGLKVALPFLVGTLSIRAITTADRYILGLSGEVEILAAYVLFVSICNSIQSIIDSGVLVYFYPKLIKSRSDKSKFDAVMSSLLLQVTLVAVPLSGAIMLSLPSILGLIGIKTYGDHSMIFYILLASAVISAYSMVWHCGLYALGLDRAITISNVMGFVAFIVFVGLLYYVSPYFAVPTAVLGSSVVMLAMKAVTYWRQRHASVPSCRFQAGCSVSGQD